MIQSVLASFAKNLSISGTTSTKLTPTQAKTDVLSGLTVALALVPEAVAFSFVAQVHPLVGLYAAFIMGLVTAVFGGRPGMISGATGAIAVVFVSLVIEHGVEYLFATVVLMGILQILAGIFRLGKFIRLVPHPVMLGFVNGLAIVIFLAQLTQFKVPGTDNFMTGMPLVIMLALVALTMAVVYFLPKVTNIIPAPLAGILITAVVVIAFGINVPRVGDMAQIKGGLPTFHIPAVPMFESMDSFLSTMHIIFPYALIAAAVGLIESLLTLNLVGEIKGERGGVSQECLAQGAGNVISGFFGSMGGCAMIGQSMINVKSGGRTRLAGIAAALFLLAFIMVASPLIEQIPLAALVGVMFMVVIGTFAWNSFNVMRKVPRVDAFVIVLVTVVTVLEDLAIAVVVGVIVSALAYAWQNASRIHAKTYETPEGAKVYQIQGPLFFGSAEGFLEMFDPANDPSMVIVDFADSRVADQSALNAIESLAAKYEARGKEIQLRHLSRDCHRLLSKAGHLMVDSDDDPDYQVATDYVVRTGVLGSGH
ncbi:SulP family inorganic anion transporter [Celeribacter halophilus]|uniref:SulP family inorganic anion transporter n=1 Tax=Celeribacter halophilus TaxID=576117 RepID=A0AAW7XSV4_9RHOB|nr:SulP family inorganic anion transporter [Celeribacter halophilus]MDO6456349.1 SulP family inorganic anion transporter [Celeribacter halophilus]MDO6722812.1 SulP family inorganic anion transporter [Celeribacter halophilus]